MNTRIKVQGWVEVVQEGTTHHEWKTLRSFRGDNLDTLLSQVKAILGEAIQDGCRDFSISVN